MGPGGYSIERLDPQGIRVACDGLAALLIDCVEGGASVGFMDGVSPDKAQRFWLDVADSAARDRRLVFVAIRTRDPRVVGTVQLIPATYENQPHRAEIAKMQVLRSERRQGIGTRLMRAAEAAALQARKTLLTLDTASEDAKRLYASLGWTSAGSIPNYALFPDGAPCATTFYFKHLNGAG